MIIAGTTVGGLALHYFYRNQILALKVLANFDLRHLCRVVQAALLARLGVPTPEESTSARRLKSAKIASLQEPGGAGIKTRTAKIVLRGATQNHLEGGESWVSIPLIIVLPTPFVSWLSEGFQLICI